MSQKYNVGMRLKLMAFGCVMAVMFGCAKPAEQPPTPTPSPAPETGASTNAKTNASSDDTGGRNIIKDLKKTTPVPIASGVLRPSPKGTASYVTSATGPEALAKEAEDKMSSLIGVACEASSKVEFAGGRGMNVSHLAIEGNKKFRCEYVKLIQTKANPSLTRETVIVNQANAVTMNGDSAWLPKVAAQRFIAESAVKPSEFATTFPRTLLTALAGGHPLTNLIKAAKNDGLEVSSEERYVQAGSRNVLQRRLLINRKREDVAKLGAFDIEVVIDGNLLLPVTIRTNVEAPNEDPTRIMWTAKWRKMNASQKFAADAFNIPAPTKTAPTKKA